MKSVLIGFWIVFSLASNSNAAFVSLECEETGTLKKAILKIDFENQKTKIDVSKISGKKFIQPLEMYKKGTSYIFEFDADGPLSKGFDYFVLQPVSIGYILTYSTRTATLFASSAIYKYTLLCQQ